MKLIAALSSFFLLNACTAPAPAPASPPTPKFPQPTLHMRLPATLAKRSIRAYIYKGSVEIAHAENISGDGLIAWTEGPSPTTDLVLHPGPGQYRVAIWIANAGGGFQGFDTFGAIRSITASDSTEIEFLAHDLSALVAVPIMSRDHATCELLPDGQQLGPSAPFLVEANNDSRFGLIAQPYDLICWSGPSIMAAQRIGVKRHFIPDGTKIRVALEQRPFKTFSLDGTKPVDSDWEFGFSATPSLKADAFRPSKFVDNHEALQMWHPGPGREGYYPYTALNTTSDTAKVFGGVIVRPKQVAMEGANDGRFSIVRFVAPTTGTYWLNTQVEGVHVGPSTTDVHVLLDDRSLFDAWIEGYGGDPRFHAIVGAHPNTRYAALLDLRKGEIVSFALGYGFNRTHFGDTTGVTPELRLLNTK